MNATEAINVGYYTDICAKPYLYPVPTAQSHASTHDIEVNGEGSVFRLPLYSDRRIWFCNACLQRRRITVTLIPKQKIRD
jgi:hypothetical protein